MRDLMEKEDLTSQCLLRESLEFSLSVWHNAIPVNGPIPEPINILVASYCLFLLHFAMSEKIASGESEWHLITYTTN